MLDKAGAQNKATSENQGKQRELSDHSKSIKMLFLKKINKRWSKKDKNIDWNNQI